jgi:two-component system, NarL family, nitrate/nitrite response regulator NarL
MTHDNGAQIRVLIADRQPLFRDGLARAIDRETGLRLVAEADDAATALKAIRRLSPDVAVLDVDLDALRILAAVAQHGLGTRVALMTADVRRNDTFEAVAAGALGCLSKQVKADIVCDAIRRVAAGHAALCTEAQSVVTAEIRLRHRDDHRLLSPREFEVLQLMAQGLSYPEIGRRLHLAPTTVKSYAGRVYERLGVRDRLAAVVEAMRRGLLA